MDLLTLQKIALSVANERSAENVLNKIVRGMSADKKIALARIWLIKEADKCESCKAAEECKSKKQCLHLIASSGNSIQSGAKNYSSLDGSHSRIPLGVRKVGTIGKTGESILYTNISYKTDWIKDPYWAQHEQILSFAGQPLIFQGEILGVLAIFSRQTLSSANVSMLRSFADNAAASIANARSFEEITALRQQLEYENNQLKQEVRAIAPYGEIIGKSPALLKVLEQVEMVSPTAASVLIQGESGTGKELIARAIHEKSTRTDGKLVKVNCASIPKELFESELFGHVRGAFTGAIKDRTGKFQLAHKGTLFLDEIAEIPLELQGKLLRALQEGEVTPLGEDKTLKLDVRIIAATNVDLKEKVQKKTFREDLFYRLTVFPIEIPSLRERKSDIPPLAVFFLESAAKKFGMTAPILKEREISRLKRYHWPGNIRELQNIMERALILSGGKNLVIQVNDREDTVTKEEVSVCDETEKTVHNYDELRELEKKMLIKTLKKTNGKVSGYGSASQLLGIKSTTLESKLKALNIDKRKVLYT
ncbi:MAG: sigma 54-interacting transcriptional regulator [Nitrospinae bacterium]|nr:sigma 54-interacting transcriptional regulator [Nitrospinota bacterium]